MPGTIGACVVPARHLLCPNRPHTRPDCVRCQSHWKFNPTGERSCLFGHGAQSINHGRRPGRLWTEQILPHGTRTGGKDQVTLNGVQAEAGGWFSQARAAPGCRSLCVETSGDGRGLGGFSESVLGGHWQHLQR